MPFDTLTIIWSKRSHKWSKIRHGTNWNKTEAHVLNHGSDKHTDLAWQRTPSDWGVQVSWGNRLIPVLPLTTTLSAPRVGCSWEIEAVTRRGYKYLQLEASVHAPAIYLKQVLFISHWSPILTLIQGQEEHGHNKTTAVVGHNIGSMQAVLRQGKQHQWSSCLLLNRPPTPVWQCLSCLISPACYVLFCQPRMEVVTRFCLG